MVCVAVDGCAEGVSVALVCSGREADQLEVLGDRAEPADECAGL
jgi:hypothetical protein